MDNQNQPTTNDLVKRRLEELKELQNRGVMPYEYKFDVDSYSEQIKADFEKYEGKVPRTFEELEALPGVGHKTASVVMSQGFGFPAFPVDTHIHRLAQRWGLTNGKNVVQTEKDLKKIFPKKHWNKLHLQIIFYGREYCKARDCFGLKCKICMPDIKMICTYYVYNDLSIHALRLISDICF